ncbi:hypothetical protein VUR80DRAFT_3636 [Thermomyces stellatus]
MATLGGQVNGALVNGDPSPASPHQRFDNKLLHRIFEIFLRDHHLDGNSMLWPIVWVNTRRNMENIIEPAAMLYPDTLIRTIKEQRHNPLLGVSRMWRELVFSRETRRYISLPVYFYPGAPPPSLPHGRLVDHVIVHLQRDVVVFDHEASVNPHASAPYGGLRLDVRPFPPRIPRPIYLEHAAMPALRDIALRIRVAMPRYGPDPRMLSRAVQKTGFYFRRVLLRSAFEFQTGNYPTFTGPWVLVHLCEHHPNLRAHHFDLFLPCGDRSNPWTEAEPTAGSFWPQMRHKGYFPLPYNRYDLPNEHGLVPDGGDCECLQWHLRWPIYQDIPKFVELFDILMMSHML